MKNKILRSQKINEYQIKNLRRLFFMFAILVINLSLTSLASAQAGDKLRKTKGAIPERYIVVLNEDVNENLRFPSEVEDISQKLAVKYGGKVDKLFKYAIKGYSVEISAAAALLLSLDERVKYVEEDVEVYAATTQRGATGGLDRIDQRNSSLNGIYNYTATGSGVHAYVIDSGIRSTHADFGGRVVFGFDVFADGQNGNDCNGHGTHVAGTIGSSTYGVAKNVTLHTVRVLNCAGSGTVSGVIAGIDWVTGNHVKPAVANLSLSANAVSTSLDEAVKRSVSAGITYVVAAGNNNADACNYSPARVPTAITVGATSNNDARASFSNFGSCLDIFAPGVGTVSLSNANDTSVATMSGTSMASPHVAGVAALFLETNQMASPAMVADSLTASATTGLVTNAGIGSPNRLLYSLFTSCPGQTYTETLSGTGAINYHSSANGFNGKDGIYQGTLNVSGGNRANFILEKQILFLWVTVANSANTTSSTSINYNGTAGKYRWRVSAVSGSSSYTLCTITP
jgi:subtilisin family serine protease